MSATQDRGGSQNQDQTHKPSHAENHVAELVVSFFAGVVFAVGLAISGMTQPQRVIGFLDPWAWDPSLLFVMLGAISVHMLSFFLIKKRRSPLLTSIWHLPTRTDINWRLVTGSAIFGLGWGLGGFCPGPGLTSLASGDLRAFLFVGAMVVGILIYRGTQSLPQQKRRERIDRES